MTSRAGLPADPRAVAAAPADQGSTALIFEASLAEEHEPLVGRPRLLVAKHLFHVVNDASAVVRYQVSKNLRFCATHSLDRTRAISEPSSALGVIARSVAGA